MYRDCAIRWLRCEHSGTYQRGHALLQGYRAYGGLVPPVRLAGSSGWGYGFSFRDSEGDVWGVALEYGSRFDDRAGFIYP
jgi:hypothetical protein